MSKTFPVAVARACVAALLVTVAPAARAEDAPPQPAPTQPQPQYTAPLYQQTQPSYVPQSVALSGPREIRDWQEGEPIPPGYHPVTRVRKGLIIGGAVTFGTLYLFSAMIAATGADVNRSGSNPVAALWIPVVGPFVQMAKTESAVGNLFLGIDGVAQLAGAAMLIVGITSPRTALVRNDLAQGDTKPTLSLVPVASPSTAGVGLVGTF